MDRTALLAALRELFADGTIQVSMEVQQTPYEARWGSNRDFKASLSICFGADESAIPLTETWFFVPECDHVCECRCGQD